MFIQDVQQNDRTAVLFDSEVDDTLVCREVRQETHDVKTFVFSAIEPRVFRYVPGQFMTLELEIGGKIINRCYTLSSSPSRPDRVSITVKRVPRGLVSNWLHDNLNVGDKMRVSGVAGNFSCFSHPMSLDQKYLFLSAGSGITPLMSMSREIHDLALDADIVFLHNARTPADIIFRHELELMAINRPSFRLGLVCEKRGDHASWSGFTGLLTHAILQNGAPDFLQRKIFTCGPAPYMASVRRLLQEAGFDMANYYEESFSFEALEPEADEVIRASSVATHSQFHIEFNRTGDQVNCSADQTILAAARAAGLRLPTSCGQGLCGTCKTKMISGEVDMKHAGGIRQREVDQGWILPCCSKPLSNIVLER